MKESKIFSEQNLTEIVHYVYRVTIDGKYYIGKRTGLLNDLATGRYETSSNLVHEKLQNGHHFSKIKILQVFSSSKDALEFEKRILTRLNAKTNPKFLNQTNGNKDFYITQHTEKTKAKMSKIHKERYNPNTEEGRRNREINSKSKKECYNPNTEEGRRNREDMSKIHKERYNPDTEEGRKNREINSKSKKEYYKTEEGRKQREIRSETQRNNWDENTERGRKLRENISENRRKFWDKNTEEGRKRRKNHSEFMKENRKILAQKRVETNLQNRKNSSILGELMFDEDFIRQNLLITDDKNNPRFLSSVYSKLSGYCESQIRKQKRIGKLSFLYGIKSISISKEQENAKIKEIEAIIKSRKPKK